jgi:beta-glucosidase
MEKTKYGIPYPGFAEFSRIAAADGAVLLKNDDSTLPLRGDETVSLFGRMQIDYYRSGIGSGGRVNVTYAVSLLDGLRSAKGVTVNEELAEVYKNWIAENPFNDGRGAFSAVPWRQEEMPLSDEVAARAAAVSKKAVVVIGRSAGEEKDNADVEGSYRLTKDEYSMLATVCKHFDSVIVVLNVSNIVDMSWMDGELSGSIKAVIYTWHGGVEGGNAAADVLTGAVTPSGRLSDTIAYNYADYPSAKNYGGEDFNLYEEDVYVGYRYFETFCPEKVRYEFGFGLSYTSFSEELVSAEKKDDRVIFSVKVTNTGDTYSARQVVQMYCTAPQGKLGKPRYELCGFAKTSLLAPAQSEVVEIDVPLYLISSYDDSGVTGNPYCYVLEAGEYVFSMGASVKQLKPVYSFDLPSCEVTRRNEQALAPIADFSRMKTGAAKPDGTYELSSEPVPKINYSLKERIDARLPKALPITGDMGITLRDVSSGKSSMESFIAQFSEDELAAIVRGEGMSSPKVTPGTASAFGGVTDTLFCRYEIPVAVCSDGPSGIRMECGAAATQISIGTLLACTWDMAAIEELYTFEGKELISNDIDNLLGPGLNIHRSPINGRNFEYFSEDPLLSGRSAAAVVRGVMNGGATATLKHFACNNQEHRRNFVDAVVSERALREIYLKGFEIAVTESDANSIMTTYNPLNGHWNASSYDLCTTILRGEWGFTGIVMTDWWAKMNDNVEMGEGTLTNLGAMVRAQNDLYMVVTNNGAANNLDGDNIAECLQNGKLTVGELQRSAKNICEFMTGSYVFARQKDYKSAAKPMSPSAAPSGEVVLTLTDSVAADMTKNEIVSVKVETAGEYYLSAEIMSPSPLLMHSGCNIMLGDEIAITIQLGGSGGQWVRMELAKLCLETGYYDLSVDHVFPGMAIRMIELNKESSGGNAAPRIDTSPEDTDE